MKKPVQLLLFFGSAILFIVILYYTNGGPTPPPPPPPPPGIVKFQSQIDSLSGISYDADFYRGIKQEILGAHAASELSDEEKSGLIQSLELAKTKSLITAFDQAKSNACLSPQPLAGFVRELKGQLKLFKYPAAQVRINRYQNLVSFLSLQNQIQSFMNLEFSESRKTALAAQISAAAKKEGVAGCANSTSVKNNCLKNLSDFENAYNYYRYYTIDKKKPCYYNEYRKTLINYKFYYDNFKCE